MPRLELADVAIDRARGEDVAERQIFFESAVIDLAVPRRAPGERLDLATEVQGPIEHRIEERLLAQAIARQQQLAPALIVDGEREHPLQAPDGVGSPLFVGVNDRLGVRGGPEAMAARLELLPELAVVVDLAVEDDPDAAVLVLHRLMAAGAVDDGQPAVTERRVRIGKHAAAVRAAVPEAVGH